MLWDMDGTLIESGDAIMGRIARTLLEYGVAVPDRRELRLLLGPPTHEILGRYLAESDLEPATHFYRGLAEAEGMTGFTLFEGIRELLADIHEAGIPLATATTKRRSEAALVVDHFEIGQYFSVIAGADPEHGILTKAHVVTDALHGLGAGALDSPVMIGDRVFDVDGAARNGVPTIMCRWGYAEESEFGTAYAIAESMDDLRTLLLA